MKKAPRAQVFPVILVLCEEHAYQYFICNTQEELYKAALITLKERNANRFYPAPPIDNKPPPPSYTEEEAENLKGGAKEAALKELRTYKLLLTRWKDMQEDWLDLKSALDSNDGRLALQILKMRSHYEHERIEVEYPRKLEG